MKAKQAITASAVSAAVGAIAAAFWNHRRVVRVREARFECKFMQDAIETMEGEGGPVCS